MSSKSSGGITFGQIPISRPAMCQIVSMLFFHKKGVCIKCLEKVDMPLNKETEQKKKKKDGNVSVAKNEKRRRPHGVVTDVLDSNFLGKV